MSNNTKISCSGSPCFILFIVFLVLKLTNTIAWSWWWVSAPLWIPFGLAIVFYFIAIIFSVLFGKEDY